MPARVHALKQRLGCCVAFDVRDADKIESWLHDESEERRGLHPRRKILREGDMFTH